MARAYHCRGRDEIVLRLSPDEAARMRDFYASLPHDGHRVQVYRSLRDATMSRDEAAYRRQPIGGRIRAEDITADVLPTGRPITNSSFESSADGWRHLPATMSWSDHDNWR